MPELPEVETVVRVLGPRLAGRGLAGFSSSWPRQVSPSVRAVRRAIHGRTVTGLGRRGKQIVVSLDDRSALLIHLKMSGRLELHDAGGVPPRHARARFELAGGGTLFFCDARKFGRIRHAADPAAALAHLGPEPLDVSFSAHTLAGLLDRRRKLKPLLLDQTAIAGLGNIYTDEALHRARLHPERRADSLTWDEAKRLHRAIRRVLREAVRRCGTSFDWAYPGGRMQKNLRVYRRGGRPCKVCGTPIQVIRVGQRSTHLCPSCQKP